MSEAIKTKFLDNKNKTGYVKFSRGLIDLYWINIFFFSIFQNITFKFIFVSLMGQYI